MSDFGPGEVDLTALPRHVPGKEAEFMEAMEEIETDMAHIELACRKSFHLGREIEHLSPCL